MPPYSSFKEEGPWRITNCKAGLGLQKDDLLTFDDNGITVQRGNDPSFPWAPPCTYDSVDPTAVATHDTQTYNIVLNSQDTPLSLTCTPTPTLPTFILRHSGSAAGGGVSRQILITAGGIVVGALAGVLAGLPPISAFVVAAVSAGVVSLGYLQPSPPDQEETNAGGDGSSWTAVGGGAGGSGGNPPPYRPAI